MDDETKSSKELGNDSLEDILGTRRRKQVHKTDILSDNDSEEDYSLVPDGYLMTVALGENATSMADEPHGSQRSSVTAESRQMLPALSESITVSGNEGAMGGSEESELCRSTRNRRPPQWIRDGTYIMCPQTVSSDTRQNKFHTLWDIFLGNARKSMTMFSMIWLPQHSYECRGRHLFLKGRMFSQWGGQWVKPLASPQAVEC